MRSLYLAVRIVIISQVEVWQENMPGLPLRVEIGYRALSDCGVQALFAWGLERRRRLRFVTPFRVDCGAFSTWLAPQGSFVYGRQRINDEFIVWLNTQDFKDETSKGFSALTDWSGRRNTASTHTTHHVINNRHILLTIRPPSRSRVSRRQKDHVRRKRRRLLHTERRDDVFASRPRHQYLQSL